MGVLFSRRSAQRTEQAVRRVERSRLTRVPRSRAPLFNDYLYDRVRGQASVAFTGTSPTITIANVKSTKGPSPLDDPSSTTETLTVQNTFKWDGAIGNEVWAEFHQDDNLWHAYQVEC